MRARESDGAESSVKMGVAMRRLARQAEARLWDSRAMSLQFVDAIRSRIAKTLGWKRQQWATIKKVPEPAAAASIASQSATETAMGFSTNTCLPAFRAATDCGA